MMQYVNPCFLCQVKYDVDPVYLKPGEGRLFLEHLSQQIVHIDVWDGDSLLLIGTCTVDLQVTGQLWELTC